MDDNRILTNKIFKQKINELVGADVIELEAANDDLALNCKIFETGMDAIKELIINDGSDKELYLHNVCFSCVQTNITTDSSSIFANIYTDSKTPLTDSTLYSYFDSIRPTEAATVTGYPCGGYIRVGANNFNDPVILLTSGSGSGKVAVKVSSSSDTHTYSIDNTNTSKFFVLYDNVTKIL